MYLGMGVLSKIVKFNIKSLFAPLIMHFFTDLSLRKMDYCNSKLLPLSLTCETIWELTIHFIFLLKVSRGQQM